MIGWSLKIDGWIFQAKTLSGFPFILEIVGLTTKIKPGFALNVTFWGRVFDWNDCDV